MLPQRTSNSVSASPGELTHLDRPEKILRLAIREMEASIAEATLQTAQVMATERTLAKKLELNRRERAEWQQRAVAAIESSDDESACRALRHRRAYDRMETMLDERREAACQASIALRRRLDTMRGKLLEARQRLASLLAQQETAEARRWMSTAASEDAGDGGETTFFRFRRWEERKEQGGDGLHGTSELRCLVPELVDAEDNAAPQEDREVTAELTELKRQLGK
jgi:phage shock protein A